MVSFRTLFPPNQLCPGLFYRNLQQDGSRYEIPTVILPHSASISTMYSLFKSSKGLLLQNFCQTCLVLLMNSGVKVTCPQVIYPKHSKHWSHTVAHTIDCVCSKMLKHGLNLGSFISLFKLIPCPIHWIVILKQF